MLEKNNIPKKQDGVSSESNSSSTNSRRRFIRKAALSAPIITTIAAKPAWGSTIVCSGSVSGNVSQHGDDIQGGCSQGRWKKIADSGGTKPGDALPNSWPTGAYVDGKPFGINNTFESIFGREPAFGNGATLGQVMADNPQGNDKRAKMEHFAIAYALNWFTFAPIILAQAGNLANYRWPSIDAMILDYQSAVDTSLPPTSDFSLIAAMIIYLEDSWRDHI